MGRTIAIANQKGGVGKTTTAINLSAALAEKGKKVLTIDLDPQGNTTSGLGVDKNKCKYTIYELMLDECSIKQCIRSNVYDNLYLLPSNVNLAAAEIELIGIKDKEYILKKEVEWIKDDYDYIIIDCSPVAVAADAELWMHHVDTVALVVRQDRADVRVINDTVDLIWKSAGDFSGFVLNAFQEEQPHPGSGGRYGEY